MAPVAVPDLKTKVTCQQRIIYIYMWETRNQKSFITDLGPRWRQWLTGWSRWKVLVYVSSSDSRLQRERTRE
jgi:hypothetical protein